MQKIRDYCRLAKPGVLAGNMLTALAGYFLAVAHQPFRIVNFVSLSVGMTLVVGGACALNNYYDRDIDKKMTRTKTRPSVVGSVSPRGMVFFSWSLFLIGCGILAFGTNWITLVTGIAGFVIYVWLYGRWTKRTSIHGAAVGAISGALPIVAGYLAVRGVVDPGAVIVFLIMFFWQFPEFYSIAIYRRKEYKTAGVPVMPVIVGVHATILQIFVYTTLYVISTLALVWFGYAHWVYLIVMLLSGVYWVWLALEGLQTSRPDAWAKQMFRFSMIMVLLLCVMITVGPHLL